MNRGVCGITGTNGYVGGQLTAGLTAAGWTVRPLLRAAFDLRQPQRVPDLQGLDALVLCAWDFSVHGAAEEAAVNIHGTMTLLQAAGQAGVQRIALISTLSAFAGTPSAYGAAKLEVERAVLAAGGTVLRPGLVWSDAPGGMVGALQRLVGLLPVVPVVGARQPMWLCHADDLSHALDAALLQPNPPVEPVPCAHPQPLAFAQILAQLARATNQKRFLVPVPLWTVAWPLRALERLGVRLRTRSDGLVGLFAANPDLNFARDQQGFGPFRPFTRD